MTKQKWLPLRKADLLKGTVQHHFMLNVTADATRRAGTEATAYGGAYLGTLRREIQVYKKVHGRTAARWFSGDAIMALLLPVGARVRWHEVGGKMRASHAMPVSGDVEMEQYVAYFDHSFRYVIGRPCQPHGGFAANFCECDRGIHFFLTDFDAGAWQL